MKINKEEKKWSDEGKRGRKKVARKLICGNVKKGFYNIVQETEESIKYVN